MLLFTVVLVHGCLTGIGLKIQRMLLGMIIFSELGKDVLLSFILWIDTITWFSTWLRGTWTSETETETEVEFSLPCRTLLSLYLHLTLPSRELGISSRYGNSKMDCNGGVFLASCN